MKFTIFAFLLCQFAFAQLPDVSFNGVNNWTTSANVSFNTLTNEATFIGSNTANVRTNLDVNLVSPPADFYFVAEFFLNGVAYNLETIKNPQLIVRDNNNVLIGRINLNSSLENQWFKAGVRIKNYSSNLLKLELGINNTTGTVKVRGPLLTTTAPVFTYDFPFVIPSNTSSSLNVNLSQKHNFQNDLLSTNSHFVYANSQWGDSDINSIINTYFPMSNLRFPGGTVGNFYNYQTDSFYLNTNTPNNLTNFANNGYVFNYNGYKNLVISSGATSTLMFNVLTNTPSQSKLEYQNRLASGLPIKWIEIGNEMYGASNLIGNITDVTSYITHAQQFSTELKSVNPNVKVAVCLEKDDFLTGNWNQMISQNQTYFDAATLHNYIAVGNYFYNKYAVYSMLKGYKTSTDRFSSYNNMFPAKPMLITEWGITTEVDEPYFVQTLGLADVFLAIEKANQLGIVSQAGIHMLYKDDSNNEATLVYKNASNNFRFSTKGVLYTKLFEVFKNSEVFNADIVSSELEPGLNAIYGKMVKKGTDYKVFLVNKLPVSSSFSLTIDNVVYNGPYTIETYAQNLDNPVNGVSLSNISNSWTTTNLSGGINLPASSINVITINESVLSSQLLSSNEFEVYPNPATDVLYWKSNSDNVSSILILDSLGRQILFFEDVNFSSLNISDLSKGVYFFKFQTREGLVVTRKIMKE